MYLDFGKFLERFYPHWNCPDLLEEELWRAMKSLAAKNLWPNTAGGDIE